MVKHLLHRNIRLLLHRNIRQQHRNASIDEKMPSPWCALKTLKNISKNVVSLKNIRNIRLLLHRNASIDEKMPSLSLVRRRSQIKGKVNGYPPSSRRVNRLFKSHENLQIPVFQQNARKVKENPNTLKTHPKILSP